MFFFSNVFSLSAAQRRSQLGAAGINGNGEEDDNDDAEESIIEDTGFRGPLTRDRALVIAAVRQKGEALRFASPESSRR